MIYFHIGHHKTATTWLQSGLLKEHPQIHLLNNPTSPWANTVLSDIITQTERSFNIDKTRQCLQDETNSVDKSLCKLYSAERLSGHPLNGGVDSFRTAKRLFSLCPDAKIIIGIRSQETMIHSVYTQLVKAGYTGSFASLMAKSSWKTPNFNLDYFEYDHIVEFYQSLFGRKNVLVLFYEDLLIDKKEYISQVLEFMSLEYFEPSNVDLKTNSSQQVNLSKLLIKNNLKQIEHNLDELNSLMMSDDILLPAVDSLAGNDLASIPFDICARYSRSNINLFRLLDVPLRADYPCSL